MHVDTVTAALLAQVLPVLVLALIIDTRLRRPRRPFGVVAIVSQLVRLVAAYGGITTTFASIVIVSGGAPLQGAVGVIVDVMATVSLFALFVAFLMTLAALFDREADRLWKVDGGKDDRSHDGG